MPAAQVRQSAVEPPLRVLPVGAAPAVPAQPAPTLAVEGPRIARSLTPKREAVREALVAVPQPPGQPKQVVRMSSPAGSVRTPSPAVGSDSGHLQVVTELAVTSYPLHPVETVQPLDSGRVS